MSKTQRDALGSEGSGECFRPDPARLHIAEDDPKHPNHAAHALRVAEDDPENVALYESMLLNGWARGSVIAIYSDGGRYVVAAGRRRLTVLRRVNVELKRLRKPPIRPYAVITDDPAVTEAAENANRKDDPPLVKARRYVELREEMAAARAAALLGMRLDYANALALCLSLPADIRAKVNSGEMPPDVAARVAKKEGSNGVAKIAAAAKDTNGKVDPGKARAAAKDVAKRPKAVSRPVVLAMADVIVKRGRDTFGGPENIAALIRYLSGDREQVNGRPWLLKLVNEAEAAAKATSAGA